MSTNEKKILGLSNKIISESCSKNCFGKLSNSSRRRMSNGLFWRIVQQFTSDDCPKEFYRKLSNVFSRTKTFCFENSVFSHLAYACVKESKTARDVGNGKSHLLESSDKKTQWK